MCYYIGLVMDVMFWRSTISYIHCFHIHWLFVLPCIWTTVLFCKTCNIILLKTIWVCMLFESTCLIQLQVENPPDWQEKSPGLPCTSNPGVYNSTENGCDDSSHLSTALSFFFSPFFFFLNAGCQQPIFMHIYCTGYIRPSSVFIHFCQVHPLTLQQKQKKVCEA